MELGLVDNKILITGASRGIGLAIARGFATEGAKVWLLARSRNRLEAVQQELRSQFGQNKVMSYPCDCTDTSQLEEAKCHIEEQWGNLDTIVSNVGNGRSVADALPEGQFVHVLFDAPENLPGIQATHVTEPVSAAWYPARQALHTSCPVASMNWPFSHLSQSD